jgi:hypothetical protein
MTTIANHKPEEEQTPLERIKIDVHQLLRRGMRLVKTVPADVADAAKAALKELDAKASAYNEWRGIEKQAKTEADALKPAIEDAVAKQGTVPDGAPKSQRVDTPSFICTLTTGSTMEIDDESVLQFDFEMNTRPLRDIFDQLFVRHVSYTLSPKAHQLMKHGKLPKAHEEMIRDHYKNSFSAKDKSPSLIVKSKDELKLERLAAIAAAEKKVAKKTGKERA